MNRFKSGQVYFYQAELPYDANQSFADNQFVGYKVASKVDNHKAVGVGIYSNFRDYNVSVWTGVVHPSKGGIKMKNIFTVTLANDGKISSVVNGHGPGPTNDNQFGQPFRCRDELCSGEG